jgi:hypothetical protein
MEPQTFWLVLGLAHIVVFALTYVFAHLEFVEVWIDQHVSSKNENLWDFCRNLFRGCVSLLFTGVSFLSFLLLLIFDQFVFIGLAVEHCPFFVLGMFIAPVIFWLVLNFSFKSADRKKEMTNDLSKMQD